MKRMIAIGLLAGLSLLADDGSPKGEPDGVSDGSAAVPEPATIGMLGLGMAGIAFGAWRKRRKK